jgi:hypothetical protein
MKSKFKIDIYSSSKKDFVKSNITNNLRFALFPNDNAVTQAIIKGWQYEDYMFDFFSENNIDASGCDIIDIGANNGGFAVDFAHLVGDKGKVHSFEAQRIIYYQLCANVFINGLDNVYCYNAAVGDENKIIEMEKPDYFSLGSVNFGDVCVKNKTSTNTERVQMVKIDNFNYKNVVFIKIDVQGYEPFVLDGALETIKKHRPFIHVEFEQPNLEKFGWSEEMLEDKIKALNYDVNLYREGVAFQSWNGRCIDKICIPKEKAHLIKKIP